MKKYIFTESQVKKIMDGVVEEQLLNELGGNIEDHPNYTNRKEIEYERALKDVKNLIPLISREKIENEGLERSEENLHWLNTLIFKKLKAGDDEVLDAMRELAWSRVTKNAINIITHYKNDVVEEQVLTEGTDMLNVKKAIQCFLNKVVGTKLVIDGLHGDGTEAAISKFQEIKKIYPVDGVWGKQTYKSLSDSEIEIMKDCRSETGDIIDKFLVWLGL